MKTTIENDYEKGRIDGFCCIEARYPHNVNYMSGHARGFAIAEREFYATQTDSEYMLSHPTGPDDRIAS